MPKDHALYNKFHPQSRREPAMSGGGVMAIIVFFIFAVAIIYKLASYNDNAAHYSKAKEKYLAKRNDLLGELED